MVGILSVSKKILIQFCVVFTFATLASCAINLPLGFETDTYSHILDRAALSFIGCIIITIMLELNFKNKVLNFIVPYVIFMPLAFLYVFISGFFNELHPNAYRDIFLNDTIAYIVVYIGLFIYSKVSRRKANKRVL